MKYVVTHDPEENQETTIRALMNEGLSRLSAAGISSPRRNTEWMLCEVLGVRRSGLYAHLERTLNSGQTNDFRRMVDRRSRHEPLQYILGYTEFFGMHFDVSPDVLIPRPETEQVVEEALRTLAHVKTPRVLDVGTGSGCIALAIKRERPDADVWASDISELALAMAHKNARRLGLKIRLLSGDVFTSEFYNRAPQGLDLLISNPPYISEREESTLPTEVRDYEPRVALIAPSDPLMFYRRLAELGKVLLQDGRDVILETHSEYGQEAERILRRNGYDQVLLTRDYANRPRILRATNRKTD